MLLPDAVDDLWADPIGQFDVLRAADPVYRLLGVTGWETSSMPVEARHLSAGWVTAYGPAVTRWRPRAGPVGAPSPIAGSGAELARYCSADTLTKLHTLAT